MRTSWPSLEALLLIPGITLEDVARVARAQAAVAAEEASDAESTRDTVRAVALEAA